METFIVEVCKGVVTNQRKGTTRQGYWIPMRNIPKDVANSLWAIKEKARPSLAWDMHARQWRDLRNAQKVSSTFANAVIVTMDDGRQGIALLDF